MYALRERRQHVTQEDFEFAVAKVRVPSIHDTTILLNPMRQIGSQEEPGGQHLCQQALLMSSLDVCICRLSLDVSQSTSADALFGVTDKSAVDPSVLVDTGTSVPGLCLCDFAVLLCHPP